MNFSSKDKFITQYVCDWFLFNRPELNMCQSDAEEFYESIREEINIDDIEGREAFLMMLTEYLDRNYASPINQVCFEILHENEFKYVTSELKAIGFLYTEELESLNDQIKAAEWFENFEETEALLENEEFKENVRNILRGYWNDLVTLENGL